MSRRAFFPWIASLLVVLCTALPALASNPNPDFQGNSPPGGWQVTIDGSPNPALVSEGDVFTLSVDEHAYDFCTEGNGDDCITRIRWFWFNRTYYAPFNDGVAWSVDLEIVDPDNDCRSGEDYSCTVRAASVTQNGDFCGYPNLGFITPIIVDYAGDYSPGIPNTNGLPYILSEPLFLDIGASNCPPTARMSTEMSQGDVFTWEFDGVRSNDPDNLDPNNFFQPVPDSEGIIAWSWDFGDGNTGSGDVVTHTYEEPGEYEVTLTVMDDEGDTAEAIGYASVQAEITAAFSFSIDPNDPLTVSFDGSASSSPYADIFDYFWYFGDGVFQDFSSVTTQHTYAQPGTYQVELVVIDDLANEGSTIVPVSVGVSAPVAVVSTAVDNTNPLRVSFDGSASYDPDDSTAPGDGIDAWQWSLGDSATSNAAQLTHEYAAIGVYQASLTVTDNEQDQGSSDATVDLRYDVTASIASSPTDRPNQIAFDASGSTTHPGATFVSWQWTFGDGGSANGPAPVHQYAQPGIYPVMLTVTDDYGQTADTQINLTVAGDDPVAIATGGIVTPNTGNAAFDGSQSYDPDDSTNPGDGIVTWLWDFGDGGIGSGPTPVHSYGQNGTYTAILTVTDNEGATDSASVTVVVDVQNADGFEVTFSGQFAGIGAGMSTSFLFGGTMVNASLNALGLGASSLCGGVGDCLFQQEADGSVRTGADLNEAQNLSCDDNPGAPWCANDVLRSLGIETKGLLGNMGQAMASFEGLATVPPGGGLPTYAANRAESRGLRQVTKQAFKTLGQIQRMQEGNSAFAEIMRELITPLPADSPLARTARLANGDRIGLLPGNMLRVHSNTSFSSICQQMLGTGECGIRFGNQISWEQLSNAMSEASYQGQDRANRSMFGRIANQLGRVTDRFGRQMQNRLQDIAPGEERLLNQNASERVLTVGQLLQARLDDQVSAEEYAEQFFNSTLRAVVPSLRIRF